MNLEIANRLQKLRKEKGYSQEQLAAELGISRQAVSKWERAESSPDTDNLICLARLYDVSLDELLSTDEPISEIIENNSIDNDGTVPSVEEILLEEEIDEQKKDNSRFYKAFSGIIPLVTTITYILLGALLDLWHPAWIVFLMIPVLITLIGSIVVKKMSAFAYPVLVTAVYLLIGFLYDWWHPGWFLFLTIPVYYIIAEQVDKK